MKGTLIARSLSECVNKQIVTHLVGGKRQGGPTVRHRSNVVIFLESHHSIAYQTSVSLQRSDFSLDFQGRV